MQITLKVKPNGHIDMAPLVRRCLKDAAPSEAASGIVVERLFPQATTGNRARMYSVTLPDRLSDSEVKCVVAALETDTAFEYVEIPHRRDRI